jgi:phosphopantetheine adenylyltransferase
MSIATSTSQPPPPPIKLLQNGIAELYIDEVETLLLSDKLMHKSDDNSAEDFNTEMNHIEKSIQELNHALNIISLVENESRIMRNKPRKESMMVWCKDKKSHVKLLMDDLNKKRLLLTTNNNKRISPEDDNNDDDIDLKNKQHLQQSHQTLLTTINTLTETNQIAGETIIELDVQDKTIYSIDDKTQSVNSLAKRARSIIRSIEKGELREKIIMYGSVVVVTLALVIAIGVVIL